MGNESTPFYVNVNSFDLVFMPSCVEVGVELSTVPNLADTVEEYVDKQGFDFLRINLFNSCLRRRPYQYGHSPLPITRADITLSNSSWRKYILSKCTSSLCNDLSFEASRKDAEIMINEEISFASHLSLKMISFDLFPSNQISLAKLVKPYLQSSYTHIAIAVHPIAFICQNEEHNKSVWNSWIQFYFHAGMAKNLNLVLDLTYCESIILQESLNLWLGEQLSMVVIPLRLFSTNSKGHPILKGCIREFVISCFRLNAKIVLKGHSDKFTFANCLEYIQYLSNSVRSQSLKFCDKFTSGFEDYIQIPLQPLANNLESQTYETFECDPSKYNLYQRAIYRTLKQKKNLLHDPDDQMTVMVVGAGRGPLVRAAVNAARDASANIKIYALDKNPNAVLTLSTLALESYSNVTVISSDMRYWNPEEKADVLVSELLGSFGDNELSPECLDGALHLLKENGVCIPRAYTSYLVPISAPVVHSSIVDYASRTPSNSINSLHVPYVVKLENIRFLSSIQACFSFDHSEETVKNLLKFPLKHSNERYKCLNFKIDRDGILHGFAGYFSCELIPGVDISINPDDHTSEMFSWFPIYFPIESPFLVRKDQQLEFHIWRCVSAKNIWYEWTISNPVALSIHNSNGKSYNIGLYC